MDSINNLNILFFADKILLNVFFWNQVIEHLLLDYRVRFIHILLFLRIIFKCYLNLCQNHEFYHLRLVELDFSYSYQL